MLKLDLDMKDYSDVELEVFLVELTKAYDHMMCLSEPTEEYSMFELDVTKNAIYNGYVESTRKSIERLMETIKTEQTLRATLKEEMMKKLDSYTIAELTDLHFNVQNEIAHQRDILEKLSDSDGTNFKRDIEDFIEKQENYLTLLTDTIKKRASESSSPTEPTTDEGETTDPEQGVTPLGMTLGSSRG